MLTVKKVCQRAMPRKKAYSEYIPTYLVQYVVKMITEIYLRYTEYSEYNIHCTYSMAYINLPISYIVMNELN